MAPTPVLTIGLTTCRSEFNLVFPRRDKTSDGWIGDLAHQLESSSGHNPDITGRAEYKDGDALNEVRAIDVDKDLNDASGHGITMEKVVQYLVQRARSGFYVPFRYIIFNGRIWRRTTGWKTETYTGPNKHDKHAHLSGDYTQTADNWKGSLNLRSLVEDDMPTPEQYADAVVEKLLDTRLTDALTEKGVTIRDILRYRDAVDVGQTDREIKADDAETAALNAKMDDLSKKVDTLIQLFSSTHPSA